MLIRPRYRSYNRGLCRHASYRSFGDVDDDSAATAGLKGIPRLAAHRED
jgi:hypothetical protein